MNVYLDSSQSKAKIKVELKRLLSEYFLIFIRCSFHCIECGLQRKSQIECSSKANLNHLSLFIGLILTNVP